MYISRDSNVICRRQDNVNSGGDDGTDADSPPQYVMCLACGSWGASLAVSGMVSRCCPLQLCRAVRMLE